MDSLSRSTSGRTYTRTDPDFDMFADTTRPGGEATTAPVRNANESLVRKCVHPPSAVPGFEGLPTNDARSQVLLQFMEIGLNKTPVVATATDGPTVELTPADLSTFNYGLIIPNGLRVKSIPFVTNNGNGNVLTQDLANVDILDAYDAKRFYQDATVYRPVYRSTTAYLNATQFNNTGIVTVAQQNPNILFAGSLLTAAQSFPQFLELYKALHRQHVAQGGLPHVGPRDPDHQLHREAFQRFSRSAQLDIQHALQLSPDQVPTLDPNTSIQLLGLGSSGTNSSTAPLQPGNQIFPTSSQLANMSARSYAGKARDGVFTVQRLNTIAPAWHAAGNFSTAAIPNPANFNNGLYQCWYAWNYTTNAGSGIYIAPFYENTTPPASPALDNVLLDTLWSSDMTFSYILFEGLSLNPQDGAVSTQLLAKKYYLGYEAQPSPRSAWAGTVKLAPEPNLQAMQAMMDAFYQLKDGMPACYNFLGVLGTLIGPSLLKLGGSALSWLTNKVTESGEQANQRTQQAAAAARPIQRKADSAAIAAVARSFAGMRVSRPAPVVSRQQLASAVQSALRPARRRAASAPRGHTIAPATALSTPVPAATRPSRSRARGSRVRSRTTSAPRRR